MKIIPLGTSSGKPTLSRNVSATALAGDGEWWLFDCGEGTQMQIARAGLSPQKLSAIFITHLHGDHFNGLPGLLSSMALDQREHELTIVGPPGMKEYFELLGKLRIMFVRYPLNIIELGPSYFKNKDEELVFETPLFTCVTRPLDHRIFSLGYRFEEKIKPGRFNIDKARELGIPPGPLYSQLQSGKSITLADGRVIEPDEILGPPRPGRAIVYCLDTRPCDNAVILAQNAEWLIYEATYTDDLREEATQYGHSTSVQAAEIATRASAKNLLLTHFSSRYVDIRPLVDEARKIFPDTIAAYDLKEIEV